MKAVLVLALLLAGCAEYRAFEAGTASHGAEAADAHLRAAKWNLCRAVTVGAWLREFGDSKARAEGWRKTCEHGKDETPAP